MVSLWEQKPNFEPPILGAVLGPVFGPILDTFWDAFWVTCRKCSKRAPNDAQPLANVFYASTNTFPLKRNGSGTVVWHFQTFAQNLSQKALYKVLYKALYKALYKTLDEARRLEKRIGVANSRAGNVAITVGHRMTTVLLAAMAISYRLGCRNQILDPSF